MHDLNNRSVNVCQALDTLVLEGLAAWQKRPERRADLSAGQVCRNREKEDSRGG